MSIQLLDRTSAAVTGDRTELDLARRRRIGRQLGGVLALIVIFLAGLQFELRDTITLSGVLGLLLLPCWVRSLRHYSGALVLLGAFLLALGSGIWLAEAGKATHAVTTKYLVNNGAILLEVLITVCVILWARQLVPTWLIATVFGLGLIGNTLLTHGAGSDGNPWKFVYSVPVVVTVLGLVGGRRSRVASIIALMVLAVISVAFDSRSLMAELAIAALLIIWQMIPKSRSPRVAAVRTLLFFGIIAFGVYNIGTTLLVDGTLGQAAQQRTVQQIDTAGSVLLGGRPEAAATIALMAHQPWGYGLGVVPTTTDVAVAKTGMAAIDYDPDNGYVENYMFGTTFELHSNVGDLWTSYGIPGLILLAVVLVIVLRWVGVAVAYRKADALSLFLAMAVLWNLLFSPFFTSAVPMALAVGLMLLPRRRFADEPASGPPAEGTDAPVP